MTKSNSNNNRCGGCPYYYGEPDWCMYEEKDVPDNLEKKCEQEEKEKCLN